MKILIFYSESSESKTLSYNDDWYDAFVNNPSIKVKGYNLQNLDKFQIMFKILPQILAYDLIVFLHSTNSNSFTIPHRLKRVLEYRRSKLLIFIGNEFKLIPEKISLINELNADYIASQLPLDTANWLYDGCPNAEVMSVPHALNPDKFKPMISQSKRAIDIGVRAYEYPWYLGDKERTDILNYFVSMSDNGQINADISFDPNDRFNRDGWVNFLNSCKGTVSTEAGTSFLEKGDITRELVNKYVGLKTTKTFDEIYDKFFKNYKNPVSGKCISSRHFDVIGTKTCQIMFSGRFNDILKPNEHYISLEKDFSNIDEVMERFLDDTYRSQMVDSTYDYVRELHTHNHRIDELINNLG